MMFECTLIRSNSTDERCLGQFFLPFHFLSFTHEDRDRHIELGASKVAGNTAIPRGSYRLGVSRSERFGCDLPQVLDVPGFGAVRIYGSDRKMPSDGCIKLGVARGNDGVSDGERAVDRLVKFIKSAEDMKSEVTLVVR